MRIHLVSEHASPLISLGEAEVGGPNVHVAELAAGLARRGSQVVLHTRREAPGLPAVMTGPSGVRVEHVPAGPPRRITDDELLPHIGTFVQYLHDRWVRDPPDLVHAHFWMSGLASLIAAKDLKIPVVQTFHVLGAVERRCRGAGPAGPSAREQVERLIARRVTFLTATSSDDVFELGRMGVARSKIAVVPGGVDLREFTPEGPALDRGSWPSRLVVLGPTAPGAGIDTVISALAALPGAELLIAGGPPAARVPDDPGTRRLAAHARRCGVAERVQLLGRTRRDQVPELLRSADVVVCPPWHEPFGTGSLEAMACGVPVVATAVGRVADTVVDGVTGRLVPPRRPDLLVRALRPMLADPALRAGYGAAGADRTGSRYTWNRIACDMLRVYQRCVSGARADRQKVANAASGSG